MNSKMKGKTKVFWRGWGYLQWIWRWEKFESPVSGIMLWDRLYFGPVEIRRYPK